MRKDSPHFDNLNCVRLLLASLVAWSHSYPLTSSGEPISRLLSTHTGGSIAVQAFFLISGYLVMQSMLGSRSLSHYLLSRFLRIWPALICALGVTIFCAWISSTASPAEFLHGSWLYLRTNLLLFGGASYQLPGAFTANATDSVNGSLWTLPWEVRLYALLALLWCVGLLASRLRFNLTLLIVLLLMPAIVDVADLRHWFDTSGAPWLIAMFLFGAFARVNHQLLTPARLVVLLSLLAVASIAGFPKLAVILVVAALVIGIGFSSRVRLPALKSDISYGVYIYAYPLQQLLVHLFPSIAPLALFAATMVLLIPLSWLSWTLIEKPALSLRAPILNRLRAIRWPEILGTRTARRSLSLGVWLLLLIGGGQLLARATERIGTHEGPALTWGVFYPDDGHADLRYRWSSGFANRQIVVEPGQVPLLGHWQRRKIAVASFDPRTCKFRLHTDLAGTRAVATIALDNDGDCPADAQPLTGDWNGDGITDIGLFLRDRSTFDLHVLKQLRAQPFARFVFGAESSPSAAVAGDWDGDGIATVGVWSADEGRFHLTDRFGDDVQVTTVEAVPREDASPFTATIDGVSQVGLHSWRDGTLQLFGSGPHDTIIYYGQPGRLSTPVF